MDKSINKIPTNEWVELNQEELLSVNGGKKNPLISSPAMVVAKTIVDWFEKNVIKH